MSPFLIYVLTVQEGDHHLPVAYYSKEKESPELNNLACIITYPPWQRHGYGNVLVEISK